MRIVFGLVAVTAAACSGDDGGLPIGGGGNDGGFQLPDSNIVLQDAAVDGAPDALVAATDANIFTGRVCLAADPTALNTCATTGAGGLTVRLGTASTTTNADGTFMIEGQEATLWRVTGPNIVTSYMQIGDYEIPAISRANYNAMITNNLGGLQLNPGEGSVMVQTIRNGIGVPAVTATPTPTAAWEPFYDHPATPTTWEQDATETNGAVWITGIDVGSVSVAVTDGADTITKSNLPVFDGGITFTTAVFP